MSRLVSPLNTPLNYPHRRACLPLLCRDPIETCILAAELREQDKSMLRVIASYL
jgi:hypothetical protein